jgi:hypothetical protein
MLTWMGGGANGGCLVPTQDTKRSDVSVIKCAGSPLASGWWEQDPEAGGVLAYGSKGFCLRPATPPVVPKDCVVGFKVFIGQCHSDSDPGVMLRDGASRIMRILT